MTVAPDLLRTIGELAALTFAIGIVVGFIGAGGAGVAVAILTTIFDLPVHTAIGTAIAAMLFVTLSGAISHHREGNVVLRLGLVVGLAGAMGAVVGADTGQAISDRALGIAAGLALWGLAGLVWIRTRIAVALPHDTGWYEEPHWSARDWTVGVGLGATGGAAAAFLGVGMAPFLQLGLVSVHKLPLRQTVGTTMMALVFISAAGSIAMARHGDVSLPHLIGLTVGLGSGAYLGARFTRRAPRGLLRGAIVVVPFIAGTSLLLH